MKKRIVSLWLAAAMLLMLLPIGMMPAAAETYWSLSDGTLRIYGSGGVLEYAFNPPWYSKRDSIVSVIIENGITCVAAEAFYGYNNLTNNCLIETATNTLICGCQSSIIPDYVTTVGRYAFSGCTSLTNITIPASVTYIDTSAFYDCTALATVINLSQLQITAGSTNHGYVAYYARHVVQDAPVQQGDYWFYSDNGTAYLFDYTGNGSNITLPGSYKGGGYKIYDYAFYGNDRMSNITLPVSVTAIGNHVFDGCTGLCDVYYEALAAQREQMTIGDGNDPLLNAMWHYILNDVMAQIKENTDWGSDSTDTRFVAGVNSLHADEIGFVITPFGDPSVLEYNGAGCTTIATDTVYRSITAGGESVTAEELGGQYIVALVLTDIPNEAFDTPILIKAFIRIGKTVYYTALKEYCVSDFLY